jgi:hypothetical protein
MAYVQSGYIQSGYFVGDLPTIKELTGELDIVSSMSTSSLRYRSIIGSLNIASNLLVSSITRYRSIIGSLNVTSSLSGQIRRYRLLQGSLGIISELTGTFRRYKLLQGSLDIISELSGQIRRYRLLQGSLGIISELTGTFRRYKLLQGSLDITVVLVGFLKKTIAPITTGSWNDIGKSLTRWNTPDLDKINKVHNDPKLPINADANALRRHIYDLHAKYSKVINDLVDQANENK